jgi:hypothetical protein
MNMHTTKQMNGLIALMAGLTALVATNPLRASDSAETEREASPQQRRGFRGGESSRVYKAQITPHWFAGDTRFWYRNDLRGGAKEFILVEAEKGTRVRAFDHGKLAKALSSASGKEFSPNKLPFESIEFIEDGKAVRFEAAEKMWKCDLNSYQCTESTAVPTEKPAASLNLKVGRAVLSAPDDVRGTFSGGWQVERGAVRTPRPTELVAETASGFESPMSSAEPDELSPQQQAQRRGQGFRRGQGDGEQTRSQRSPDGTWTAFIKEHNVFIRSETEEFRLSSDGERTTLMGASNGRPIQKHWLRGESSRASARKCICFNPRRRVVAARYCIASVSVAGR